MKAQWIYSDAGKGVFSCAAGCSHTSPKVVPFAARWQKQQKLSTFPYFGMFQTAQSFLDQLLILHLHQFGYLPGIV